MKNLTKIFLAVAVAMFAFACVTDTTEDLGIKVEGQGVTELTLSLEESRTHLGEKAEGVYPLYWSEGDAIAVNGVVSAPLTTGGSATATFSFAKEVTYPLCVVYPASAVATVEGEETEAPVTAYPVNFLAEQPYTVGTFAPQAAPMYGYGVEAAEGEEQLPTQMQHLTGVLRLAIKGNGEKVTEIKVKAEKGAIAGAFTVDCTNGALTAQEGASNTVTVTFAEPLVLGAEATPVYVAVPAGSYGTFMITVNTEVDKMTVKFNSYVKPINAGAVREFAEFEYAANNADTEDGDFIIDSKEALIEFARIAGHFYPRTKAVVTADIDMTGYDWTPIEGFGAYEFDGGSVEGCEIKGLNAPLFASTSATIKNLKLTDVDMVITDLAHSGAIACDLVDGSLYNCYTSGQIEINNTTLDKAVSLGYFRDVCHGGLVGFANGASLEKCENHINLTANSVWKEDTTPTQPFQLGLSAMFGIADNGVTIKDCNNHGSLTLNAALKENKHVAVGGVFGATSSSNDIKSITNCTNYGNITVGENFRSQHTYYVGGVAAIINGGSDAISHLTNLGTIHISGKSIANAELSVSGVIADAYDKIDNLVNGSETDSSLGAIIVDYTAVEGYPNDKTYIAGIANRSGAEVTNCKNYGKISALCTTSDNTYVAGVLGSVYSANPAKVHNCYNYGDLCYDGVKSAKIYVGGIISQSWISSATESTTEISECGNSGDILVNLQSGVGTGKKYVGGIFGMQEAGSGYGGKKTFKLSDVVNSGNIYYADHSTTGECFVSGMFANCIGTKSLEIDNCESQGTLYVGYTRNDETKQAEAMADCVVGGATKFSLLIGGFAGNYNKATDTTVSGAIKVNSKFLTTDQVHIGGFGGYGGSPYDAENCTFSGQIEFNKNSSTAGALHLGGYFGYYNDSSTTVDQNTIKECTVSSTAKIVMAGSVKGELRMAGIIAWIKKNTHPMYLYGCSNYGTLELAATAGTTSTTAIGGLIGKPEAKTIHLVGCWNEGNFNIGGNSVKNICVGGLIGNNYDAVITASTSDEYPYFYNKGNIVVGNTGVGESQMGATSYVCVGGYCGYTQKADTINASFGNAGNITTKNVKITTNLYIGGCLGNSTKAHTIGADVEFVNIGNITVDATTTTATTSKIGVGGIESMPTTALKCKSYCDIAVVGRADKAGHIFGNVRTDTIKATDGGIGGRIATNSTLVPEDEYGGSNEMIEILDYKNITGDNWFEHIYATSVERSVATGDNCVLLQTIPTITYAPTPSAN